MNAQMWGSRQQNVLPVCGAWTGRSPAVSTGKRACFQHLHTFTGLRRSPFLHQVRSLGFISSL